MTVNSLEYGRRVCFLKGQSCPILSAMALSLGNNPQLIILKYQHVSSFINYSSKTSFQKKTASPFAFCFSGLMLF